MSCGGEVNPLRCVLIYWLVFQWPLYDRAEEEVLLELRCLHDSNLYRSPVEAFLGLIGGNWIAVNLAWDGR